jgi:hypothetical protein
MERPMKYLGTFTNVTSVRPLNRRPQGRPKNLFAVLPFRVGEQYKEIWNYEKRQESPSVFAAGIARCNRHHRPYCCHGRNVFRFDVRRLENQHKYLQYRHAAGCSRTVLHGRGILALGRSQRIGARLCARGDPRATVCSRQILRDRWDNPRCLSGPLSLYPSLLRVTCLACHSWLLS